MTAVSSLRTHLALTILASLGPALTGCGLVVSDAVHQARLDQDGDGFATAEYPGGEDCDDVLPDVNPSGIEICNGIDDDCDGQTDEDLGDTTFYLDSDGDGYGDGDSALERCTRPDGYVVLDGDCDDLDAAVSPGVEEVCDGRDEDCSGVADDPDSAPTWYVDSDGDGFGDALSAVHRCEEPPGYTGISGDCDDTDADTWPGQDEVCNDIDDDCNDVVDDGAVDRPTWWADSDGDGFGNPAYSQEACSRPPGYSDTPDDCDDGLAAVNPTADEVCNDRDDDCDGAIDEDGGSSWFLDADGDGYGDASSSVSSCERPSGHVADSTDCDDGEPEVRPDAEELCNGRDDNCDGIEDEVLPVWYLDSDGDGFGVDDDTLTQCDTPVGYSSRPGDCDDTQSSVHPLTDELCNGSDDDCDGDVDEQAIDKTTWYRDDDGDGHGDPNKQQLACEAPPSHWALGDDCDDNQETVSPSHSEVCGDGLDNDCSGDSPECGLMGDLADRDVTRYLPVGNFETGNTVAGPGDLDGDGLPDLAVGAKKLRGTKTTGAVYLLLSPIPRASTADIDTAHLTLTGTEDRDEAGAALSPAGDIDADGLSDLLIGAPRANLGTNDGGAAYLVLGSDIAAAPAGSVATLSSSYAAFSGDLTGGRLGAAVSSGALSDDSLLDVVIGAKEYDSGGVDKAGAVFTWFGPIITGTSSVETADLTIECTARDERFGEFVDASGDIDGDGVDDLLVGSSKYDGGAGHDSGAAYLFRGPLGTGVLSTTDADATLEGEAANDHAGTATTWLGDLDGDGLDEFAAGAPKHDDWRGAFYLWSHLPSGVVSMSTADASLVGDSWDNETGKSVSGAGDVGNDGFDDLLVGAPLTQGGEGSVLLLHGPVSGTLSLADVPAWLDGSGAQKLGSSVAAAGDLDDDGFDDCVFGASAAHTGTANEGSAIVLFGEGL